MLWVDGWVGFCNKCFSFLISSRFPTKQYLHGTSHPFPCSLLPVISSPFIPQRIPNFLLDSSAIVLASISAVGCTCSIDICMRRGVWSSKYMYVSHSMVLKQAEKSYVVQPVVGKSYMYMLVWRKRFDIIWRVTEPSACSFVVAIGYGCFSVIAVE